MKTSRRENYDSVHEQLVDRMQDMYLNDTPPAQDTPDIDLSFLKEPAASGKKRGKRYMRAAGIAAAVIIVLLGANIAMLSSDNADTYGDKGVLHRLYNSINGLFTDEDDFETDDIEESMEIRDDSDIGKAKEFFPDLYVPGYIPEGYTLDTLIIDRYYSGDVICSYSYSDDEGLELDIICTYMGEGDFGYMSQAEGQMIELEDRTMYLVRDEVFDEYNLTVYTEQCSIDVCMTGGEDEDILIKIGEGLEN